MITRIPWLIATALLLVACQAELEHGLDEAQANAIIVALDAQGIGANKTAEMSGGEEPVFTVTVSPDDVATSLAILRSEGLPRERDPGLGELFGQGSLVPTATEERARMIAALSGELARSIEAIDGVLDARVHIALPQAQMIGLDAPRPRARASVMIRHRGAAPPYEEAAIQRLVAGAIEDMSLDDVAVVGVPSTAAATGERQLTQVGPFSVSRSSAMGVKGALAALLLTNLLLAGGLVWAFLRATRLQRALDDAAAKEAKEAKK